MPLEVKICGLTDPDSVALARAAGADYVGFVFYPPSPRAIEVARAVDLAAVVEPPTRSVGLFVDPDDAELDAVLRHVPLDFVQLHGDETPERVAAIGLKTGCGTIKALRVEGADDLRPLPAYAEVADIVLFDAKPPRDAAWPGGHGLPFDWHLLEDLRLARPWALAGGLKPDNLAAAVRLLRPPIVDVSSGVESAPGVKDPHKLRAFLAEAARLRGEEGPA